MNEFTIQGKSAGVLTTRQYGVNKDKTVYTVGVVVSLRDREMTVPITTFSESIAETMTGAVNGGSVMVLGELRGREWQGKYYLDAVAARVTVEKSEQAELPLADNLDDIPF